MAGFREIDEYSDNSGMGEGFIGIDQYIPARDLRFCHFFGTKSPNNRGVARHFWDYSLNDLPVARGESILPFFDGSTGVYNGKYTLTAAPADLGSAFTLWTVNRRYLANNQDAAFLSSFGADSGYSLTLGVANSNYAAFINGANDAPLGTINIPLDSYTKTGFELLMLVVPGDGTAKLHVRRPSGNASLVASISGLPAGQVFGGRRLLAGGAYGGAFVAGDVMTAVGGYSRAMPDAEIPVFQTGLRRWFNEYSGPLI